MSSAVHSHTLPRVFQTLLFLKSNNSFVIWVTFEGIARKKCSSHRPVDNDRKPEQMHYYKYYEYFQWVWSSYLHSLNCKTAPKPLPLLKQKLICLEEYIPHVCMCVWFNSIFKDLMLVSSWVPLHKPKTLIWAVEMLEVSYYGHCHTVERPIKFLHLV